MTMTQIDATELEVALTERDVRFLDLLERRVSGGHETSRPSGTLFDLEHVAHVIDGGGPDVVFQPIVELARPGLPIGYEALSRFRVEPRRTPDVWFAQAARVGLGVDLEIKALVSAVDALDRVPGGAFLALNVSASAMCSSALRMALAGVPGDRVVLELTEHELIEDYSVVNAAVNGFRSRGFRLAVDDAGAGCAGFNHIVKVAPDVIKLDRTITRSIDRHSGRQDLAASIVALAKGIGASVLAEGVEADAELDTLRSIGVTEGQGYLFGRPGTLPSALSLP